MKYLIYGLMIIAIGFMIYNATKLNFQYLLTEDNTVPLIGVIAPSIVIVLLAILLISKKIEEQIQTSGRS